MPHHYSCAVGFQRFEFEAAISISSASAAQIYAGEPLGEALYDLVATNTALVSHELSTASGLQRTDVFRLTDGRLVAVTSRAPKLGHEFSIETLRVTSSATSKLTKRLPTVDYVEFRK